MAKVSIVAPGGGRVEIENGTAENIRELLIVVKDELGLDTGLNVAVNGAPATDETPVADGDEVTFTQPVGQKG